MVLLYSALHNTQLYTLLQYNVICCDYSSFNWRGEWRPSVSKNVPIFVIEEEILGYYYKSKPRNPLSIQDKHCYPQANMADVETQNS